MVAVARTQGGLEELDDEIRKDGGSATLVPLNLTDFDGIARLGAALHERHGKLDILVGNAGVAGPSSPLGHIEMKPWNDVMAVNVIGEFSVDPLHGAAAQEVRRRPRRVRHLGRCQQGAAPISAPMRPRRPRLRRWRGYGPMRPPSTPLRVNLFNPGPIRTRMRATVFPGEDPLTLDTPEQAAEFIVPMCLPSWTETGKFYDYKTRTLMSFRAPA